ncbi:BA75_02856T0 [Komagataella pastoris]|uniref:ER membrane protein complex subunit 1 n=1 Tax=Komagataella pastoris TaxID=4922 RepID=A0A1B2JBZ2_PICPA|nr:BA75_02856T0 [Komagataella pastoris]
MNGNHLLLQVLLIQLVAAVLDTQVGYIDWLVTSTGSFLDLSSCLFNYEQIYCLTEANDLIGLDSDAQVAYRFHLDGPDQGKLVKLNNKKFGSLRGNYLDIFNENGQLLHTEKFSSPVVDVYLDSSLMAVDLEGVLHEIDLSTHSSKEVATLQSLTYAMFSKVDDKVAIAFKGSNSDFVKIALLEDTVSTIRTNISAVVQFKNNLLETDEGIYSIEGSTVKKIVSGDAYLTDLGPISVDIVKNSVRHSGNSFEPQSKILKVHAEDEFVVVLTVDEVLEIDLETFELSSVKENSFTEEYLNYVDYEIFFRNQEVQLIIQDRSARELIITNGVVKNVLDQSLNDVVDYSIVTLQPQLKAIEDEIIEEENSTFFRAYTSRLFNTLAAFKKIIKEREFTSLFQTYTAGQDQSFGLDKRLVIGCSFGKLSAYHLLTKTPQLSWEIQLPMVNKVSSLNEGEISVLSGTTVFTIDAETGDILSETVATAEEPQKEFDIKSEDHIISGLRLVNNEYIPTWTFKTSPEEKILKVARREDDNSNVASAGLILGNNSVLFKYLFQNLISAVILNEDTNVMRFVILNAITGQQIYSDVHSRIDSNTNVNLVYDENFIVVSYFGSDPIPEQHILVYDLFESLTPNKRVEPKDGPVSNFDMDTPIPQISSQSFLFPSRISFIAASRSKFGIASKWIVSVLEDGKIFAIPKVVLNSRRVVGRDLTSTEKKEYGMTVYSPFISLPENIFTISNIRDLVLDNNRNTLPSGKPILTVEPTGLASTSFVCLINSFNVYCTQISPSRKFDMLRENFDRYKLLASIFGLLAIVLFVRPYVYSRNLQKLWTTKI